MAPPLTVFLCLLEDMWPPPLPEGSGGVVIITEGGASEAAPEATLEVAVEVAAASEATAAAVADAPLPRPPTPNGRTNSPLASPSPLPPMPPRPRPRNPPPLPSNQKVLVSDPINCRIWQMSGAITADICFQIICPGPCC